MEAMTSPSKGLIEADFELGEFEQTKVVGKGGSSTVYKGLLKKSNRIVAIKQIDTEGFGNEQILNIKGEIDTIKNLVHEHIVCYLGTLKLSGPSRILIFLEYADRGSLRQFYQRKGALSEPQAANCTRQLLEGMIYLHKNGIAHRDVKCANCLLTKDGIVKLADFGASKKFETDSVISGLKGTPHWMAPEVIKGTQMTTGWIKADVWSVGCTVVEMVTGKLPFSEYDNPMTAMYQIANGEQPPLPEELNNKLSEAIKHFIKSCCAVDPEERPEASNLKLMKFPARNNKAGGKKKSKSNMRGQTNTVGPQGGARGGASSNPNLMAPRTSPPTLTSTPSEALTEPYSNPLTRENSVAANVYLSATAPEAVQEVQEGEFSFADMIAADERLRSQASAGVKSDEGNGVGIISTATTNGSTDTEGAIVGVSTKSKVTVQGHTGPSHAVSSITQTGIPTQGSTATASDLLRSASVQATNVDDVSDSSCGEGSGEAEEDQELYLDDFEEGGEKDDDTRVQAGGGGVAVAPAPAVANNGATAEEVVEGEFSFADMVAADEAKKESGGISPEARVEYVPTPKASHGHIRQRPENRPGRRSTKNSSDIHSNQGYSVERPPLSATLRAGHSSLSVHYGGGDCGGNGGVDSYSEIDAQTAHTQSILAEAGVDLHSVTDKDASDPLRSSAGTVDTWNNQVLLRPQPSAEVFIEQTGAPGRPQAPMTGEMRRVMVTLEQQQQQQCQQQHQSPALRSSTNSTRSSISGGSGATSPLVDSDLLARAGSSGAGAVRREALEALGSKQEREQIGPYVNAQGQYELLYPKETQQQQYVTTSGTRTRSKKRGGVRSQSANAAAVGAGGSNMRLPPMGTSGPGVGAAVGLVPLGVPESMSMGIAESSGQSLRLNPTNPLGGLSLGQAQPSTLNSIASRAIWSAPSAVHGRNSIDGSLGATSSDLLAALPPIQSLTPNGKGGKKGPRLP